MAEPDRKSLLPSRRDPLTWWLVAIVALAACWGLAGMLRMEPFAGLSAEAWAAWVQAIGSIAAIVAAAQIAATQHRRDAERQDNAERERAVRSCSLGIAATKEILQAGKAAVTFRGNDNEWLEDFSKRCVQSHQNLMAILALEHPVEPLALLLRARAASGAIDGNLRGRSRTYEIGEDKVIDAACEQLKKILSEFESLLQKLVEQQR